MPKEIVNGSTQHYGPRDAEVTPPYELKNFGAISQMIVPLQFDDLPAADSDRQDIPVIPANSVILRTAIEPASTTFAGGISYVVGLAQTDGTAIDADGVYAAVTLAQVNAGGTGLATEGALVGAAIGANGAVVTAAATGTFTAGRTNILIEYMTPTAAAT
jgi:hypothetical protein